MSDPSKEKRNGNGKLGFDPEFSPGARNAVRVCLRIAPQEKVTIITDRASREIAASLVHEVAAVGAPHCTWVLEEIASRPLLGMPQVILDDLASSQVSLFIGAQFQAQPIDDVLRNDVLERDDVARGGIDSVAPDDVA